MRHLDLFSGIGGFALGLEATRRIKTVAFCEIDKYCTKVLNKNWPGVPVYNDIRELTYDRLKTDEIGSIDIITGGYPCQPFSIAGSKKGVEDPRHLWPEYFRLIKECRPTWVIGENVSGHIKLGLDAVQEDLESQSYSLRTFSVSASSIGANHQRERIWTVAYSQRNYDSQQIKRVNGEEISLQKEHRENDSTTRNSSGASAIRETRNEHADVEDARRRSWREQFTWNTESTGRGTSKKTEWSTNTDTSPGPSEGTPTMANGNENKNNWWHTEPDVGRVADGVPDRTHRLRALGNSVVPQVPYYLAQSILEVMDA